MINRTICYNFATGPHHQQALELWQAVKSLTPNGMMLRSSRVIFCRQHGLLTESEAMLLTAWLATFQVEEFAQ